MVDNRPVIGMIMLDTVFPRIPGDVGNPETFPFPVAYRMVSGASPKRVVKEADPALLMPFTEAARALADDGARAIVTSCGFLAMFQRELAAAVDVPVYSSSLLQIPMARAVIRSDQTVGVLTADAGALTPRHFAGVGVTDIPKAIVGMESRPEFSAVFLGGKKTIDSDACRREMVSAARELIHRYPTTGAVVMECTNMPPYARDVQATLNRPVFDAATLVHYARDAAVRTAFS